MAGEREWEAVELKDVRKTYHGQSDMYDAAAYAVERGWTIRDMGHKYRLYCPCDPSSSFSIGGTPRSPTTRARQIRRTVDRCPDRHDLIR